MMKIPISKTHFTEKEFENILKPLQTGWVVQGPYVAEFEKKWSEFTGAKNSIAVTSCSTALNLSLWALGIKYGDEVIVPAFTWVATANAVESIGAKPVFCDIDIATFNMDVNKLENLITPKTKAIIPVHLFGLAADMDIITEIARKKKLYIIEDAACGFASQYKNTHVGNFGEAGCFSFHPRKAITTGEGGMITTNNNELAEKLRAMRDHGATTSDLQRHIGIKPYLLPDFPYLGFNYRMTDIQASIGISQLDRAGDISYMRTLIADKYDKYLEDVLWLKKPYRHKDYKHGFQSYVCMFSSEKIDMNNISEINEQRNKFMEYLQQNGISTRPGTHGVHMLKYYADKYSIKPEDYPDTFIADRCSIAFPLFQVMTDGEFDYIIKTIKSYNL